MMLFFVIFCNFELKALIIDTLTTHYYPITLDTAIVSNDYSTFFSDGNFPTIYYQNNGEYKYKKIPFSTDKYYFDINNNLVGFDTTSFVISYYDFSKDTLINYDLSDLKIYNHYQVSFFSSNYIAFISHITNKALLFNVKTQTIIKEIPGIIKTVYDKLFLSSDERSLVSFHGDSISKYNIATQITEYRVEIPPIFDAEYKTLQPNDSIMIFYDYHNLLTFDIKNGKIIYSEKDNGRIGYYKRVYGNNPLLYFYTANDYLKPIFVNYYNGDTIVINNPELYRTATKRSIIAPFINNSDTLSARIEEIAVNNKSKYCFYVYSITEQKADTIYNDYVTDYSFYQSYSFLIAPKTKTFYNNSMLFNIENFKRTDSLGDFYLYSYQLLDSSSIIFKPIINNKDSAVIILNTETHSLDTVYKSKELLDYRQFNYNKYYCINYGKNGCDIDTIINKNTQLPVYSASDISYSLQGNCFYHKYLENNIKHLKVIIPKPDNSIIYKDFILNDTIIKNPRPNLSPDSKYLVYGVNGNAVIYNMITEKYDTLKTNFFNYFDFYFFNNSRYLQIYNACYIVNSSFEQPSGFLVIDLNDKSTIIDFNTNQSNVQIVSSINENYAIVLHFNGKNNKKTFYRTYYFDYDKTANVVNSVYKTEFNFSISPNPADYEINLHSKDDPIDYLEVYNSLGEIMYRNDYIHSKDFTINILNYPSGTYYVKVNNSTKMFIISR